MNHREYKKKYAKRAETRKEKIARYTKLSKADLVFMLLNEQDAFFQIVKAMDKEVTRVTRKVKLNKK